MVRYHLEAFTAFGGRPRDVLYDWLTANSGRQVGNFCFGIDTALGPLRLAGGNAGLEMKRGRLRILV